MIASITNGMMAQLVAVNLILFQRVKKTIRSLIIMDIANRNITRL